MSKGRVKFYADENIESYLIDYIRDQNFKVEYANELGFNPRDDQFHLQEARRRKCILLTRDDDFLDHRKFPFHNLKDTAIIVLRAEDKGGGYINFGYMLVSLIKEIAASGNKNLFGLKIELKGPKIVFHANIDGKIKTDMINISKRGYAKELFKV